MNLLWIFKKPGIILALLGMLGFAYFLSMDSLTLAEKIPTVILSLVLVIIGIIMQTPFFKTFAEGFREEQEIS